MVMGSQPALEQRDCFVNICVGLVLSIVHFSLYWCRAEFKHAPTILASFFCSVGYEVLLEMSFAVMEKVHRWLQIILIK